MRLIHRKRLICFVFVALVIFSLLSGGVGGKAYAATSLSGYSDVLDDLQKDETFNPDEYSAINDDYSLQVIQIAESTAGELFIYVYQPAAEVRELTATSINISQAINDNLKYQVYQLTLISSNGVFQKYLVEGLEIKSDVLRYYDISAIYREWKSDIDSHLPKYNENDITEVAWAVKRLYTVVTLNGEVSYSCTAPEYVTVLNPYVGRLRYCVSDLESVQGYLLFLSTFTTAYVDTFYIAFSTDKQIDRLLSADVYYVEEYKAPLSDFFGKDWTENRYVYLNASDEVVVNIPDYSLGNYGVKKAYSWDRIQSVDEFMSSAELTEEGKKDLQGQEWVLSFAEYGSNSSVLGNASYTVSDVTILRLGFETEGKTYSLGVVSNRQNPNGPPDNFQPEIKTIWDKFKDRSKTLWEKIVDFFVGIYEWFVNTFGSLPWWAWVIIAVVAVVLISSILSIFFPVLREIFKFVGWVITAPFRFIAWIIKKIRGGEE